jgi:hypothetical protein
MKTAKADRELADSAYGKHLVHGEHIGHVDVLVSQLE